MKILFSSLGTHGHTYPLIPLAIAARELGHEILYVTDKSFEKPLTAHGIEHIPGGLSTRAGFASLLPPGMRPQEVPTELIAEVFGSVMPRAFAQDVAPVLAERRPDLVVHEIGNPGAAMAAQVAGVPALCHGFGRVWAGDNAVSEVVVDHLRRLGAELGAEVPAGGPLTMVMGNPYIDICPPSVQLPGALDLADRIELRPVPFAEPGELPGWVREHREPLVYLTLGTAFGDAGVLRTAIEGLGALDARVLVATGPAVPEGAIGDVPDNVVALPWVPQAELLAHVDLVVHHGGSGTTLGAFGAGVPQLVVPQGADQFANAEAVAEHGLGERLLGEDVTAEAITARARGLLSDEGVRAAAKALAAEVAGMPSPREVAATLPQYA
ncbi:glycosyltransferase [Saccharothrix syringae]|uniref:Glycosyltransferase n=1 Tax=Saccharothrix syringae TaxID=103733 RepID=A0A5Q0GZP3_SACSY|nr:glycosyltransferase [Saccharothrix syringae]QFZ19389.1 glycosyltransferase [Saccharothrix syringae]